MSRGTRFVGSVALLACLGGCHILFGHSGAQPGVDGQPRDERRPLLDGASGERWPGDLEIGEARLGDGLLQIDKAPDTGLPPCNPTAWCPEPADTQKTLRGVWATPDAKTAYAVGDDVVLLRQGGSWAVAPASPALPAATWRGVHMVSDNAWLVGNLSTGDPVAYRLDSSPATLKAVKISTTNITTQTLNAIWMTSLTEGYAAAATATKGGVIGKVQSVGISSDQSTGQPVMSVSRSSTHAWAATAGLELFFRKEPSGEWIAQNLTGFPSASTFAGFTGVIALGALWQSYACGSGNTTTDGVIFCCQAEGTCTVVTLSKARFHGIAANATPTGVMLWLVGEDPTSMQGLVATATVTLGQPINLQVLQVSPSPLRGVWASSGISKEVIAVGDGGAIYHHHY